MCCGKELEKYVGNIFAQYNQQDATFLNLFISVRRSTCFRRFFRPSSGAQNCTYSVRYLSDRYCYLMLAAGSSNGLTNLMSAIPKCLTHIYKHRVMYQSNTTKPYYVYYCIRATYFYFILCMLHYYT